MKVKEAIAILSKEDPESDLLIDVPRRGGYNARALSSFNKGFFVVDVPGNARGCFCNYDNALAIMDNGQALLDISSPCITPAVRYFYIFYMYQGLQSPDLPG